MSFTDPENWGFCPNCHFLVAATDGVMHTHSRGLMGSTYCCSGSGHPAAEQPGPDVTPGAHLPGRYQLPKRAMTTPEVEHDEDDPLRNLGEHTD